MTDQSNHDVQMALLEADVSQMKDDIKALRQEVKDLVDAWKTANNVVSFVKWLSGFGAACGFLWAALKVKLGG